MVCLFMGSVGTLAALSINSLGSCGDPNCAYERREQRSGCIMHFDRYGNMIGRTRG